MFKNFNLDKLKSGLAQTKTKLFNGIKEAVSTKAVIDEDILDELEELLITSDIGVDTAMTIIENTRAELYYENDRSKVNITQIIKNELRDVLIEDENKASSPYEIDEKRPYVVLVVGVNGAGKTTTIGKLAHNYKKAGLSVLIASADTFRAAANEQLEIWAKRAEVEIIQKESGADPSSVVFEALEYTKLNNIDVVLIDTAGRLHTKLHLMKELEKIRGVITKVIPHAPNEVFLVLDGNSGQNALVQAKKFSKATNLTGLIITKLDGTAKGGVLFNITDDLKLPIRFVGVGEKPEDLQEFNPKSFVEALIPG